MIQRPVLVTPETELFRAIHEILTHKISGVAVVDERRRPVGMLSELDCLRAILTGSYHQELGEQLVREHMTVGVECTMADEDVFDVAKSMLDHKHRRRPVLDEHGHMVGQLTCRQLLKAIKDFDVPSEWFER
jgi:CBS domain-containing protein